MRIFGWLGRKQQQQRVVNRFGPRDEAPVVVRPWTPSERAQLLPWESEGPATTHEEPRLPDAGAPPPTVLDDERVARRLG